MKCTENVGNILDIVTKLFESTHFDFAFRVFFPEITLKQLDLKNYSSYNLFLFKMRRKLFVLFFKNFKQSIETSGYIPELLKTTLIAFEETLIKTLMEV